MKIVAIIVFLLFLFSGCTSNVPMQGCDNVADDYRETCLHDYAVANKNPAVCESLQNRYYKYKCYSDVAILKNDSSVCEKTADGRDVCYFNFAVEKNDPSFCNNIRMDALLKEDCFRNIDITTQ